MKKFQVLIVDDEVYSIKGVQAGVDWKKLHISNIFTATSMAKAQEVFKQNRIDLLLCDIEMPKGSGLDLLKWVREHYPATEAIFLTCHSDFTYAKKALQLNSFNYLLKPVDYQELGDEIKKALEKINKEQKERKIRDSYLQYEKSHRSVVEERFWLDLIQQVVPSSLSNINLHMENFNISYTKYKSFLPILVHIQSWKEELSVKDEKVLELALKNGVKEAIVGLESDIHAPIITLNRGQVLMILPQIGKVNRHYLVEKCNELISKFSSFFSCELCCYIGTQVQIQEVVSMVAKLLELDRNNVMMNNQTIEYRNVETGECSVPHIPVDDWINLLKKGSFEQFEEKISEYFSNWKRENRKITAQSLYLFYQDFLQVIFYVLKEKGVLANEVFSQKILIETPEKVLRSFNTLQEWVLYIVDVVANKMQSPQNKGCVVEMAIQFINNNIGEQRFSRQDIANHVYLNPDYLTRVFKKQTGLSISDYMQQQRLEYAKKLLEETDLPVSEVALKAGYSNFSYFSTLFKKTENISPVEYRKEMSH
ncbi:response regulator transcription factor [Metabacillus halosaccharovorans]|uniref:response regulator transcription factor n=1 Tax=Metabacillus halosaccharovorans TaxID=930124 RepID=UPI001C1FE15E|nr:helix-turn-helix domain-containing protein [Metabacillus halosaccharovorans]MBU7591211.1 helix-turn-helix domain-containing protein [Metabacillus halosaccharovorans]